MLLVRLESGSVVYCLHSTVYTLNYGLALTKMVKKWGVFRLWVLKRSPSEKNSLYFPSKRLIIKDKDNFKNLNLQYFEATSPK